VPKKVEILFLFQVFIPVRGQSWPSLSGNNIAAAFSVLLLKNEHCYRISSVGFEKRTLRRRFER